MKISYKWLCKHISLFESNIIKCLDNIDHILTDLGIEVEYIQFINPVIGVKVLSVNSLPGMRVRQAKISLSQEIRKYLSYEYDDEIEILCGANNVRDGLITAFAPINTTIPNGLNIQKRKIKDYESYGMLCSAQELGLGNDSEGIMELDSEGYITFDDILINITVPTNRSDLMCVRGIARELSFKNLGKLLPLQVKKSNIPCTLNVENKTSCYFGYTYLKDIVLKQEIDSYLKIIHRYTDNVYQNLYIFLLLDIGIPTHMYNAKEISHIIIEEENSYIAIKNQNDIISIAGVKGILGYGDENYLETAHIPQKYICENTTESAKYFRLGIDKSIPVSLYCGTLIESGIISDIIESGDISIEKKEIFLSLSDFAKVSGLSLSIYDIKLILESFDFICEVKRVSKGLNDEYGIMCNPPTYRYDINNSYDLIEEILRIHGTSALNVKIESFDPYTKQINIADILCALNFREIKTFPFDKTGEVKIQNPIDINYPYMRSNMEDSLSRAIDPLSETRVFEIGTVFLKDYEEKRLAILLAGAPQRSLEYSSYSKNMHKKYVFGDLRKIIDLLSNYIQITPIEMKEREIICEEGIMKISDDYYYCEFRILPTNTKSFNLSNMIDISINTTDNWIQIKHKINVPIYLIDYYENEDKTVYTFSINKEHKALIEESYIIC